MQLIWGKRKAYSTIFLIPERLPFVFTWNVIYGGGKKNNSQVESCGLTAICRRRQRQCQAGGQLHFLAVVRGHNQKKAVHFAVLKYVSNVSLKTGQILIKKSHLFDGYANGQFQAAQADDLKERVVSRVLGPKSKINPVLE